MSLVDVDLVVVVVKRGGFFRWYRSARDLWILDYPKWSQEFVNAGYMLPASDPDERFGIPVVNEQTIDQFLAHMEPFRIEKSKLENDLQACFPEATSWWDVDELFPILFVNCDSRHVTAFYPEGARMERYVPDGWVGEFDDFASNASENDFPLRERFWIQEGVDLLALLNERGSQR